MTWAIEGSIGRASLNRTGLRGARFGLPTVPRESDVLTDLDHLAFEPADRILDPGQTVVGNGLGLTLLIEQGLHRCLRDVGRNLKRPRGHDGFTGDPAPIRALAGRPVPALGQETSERVRAADSGEFLGVAQGSDRPTVVLVDGHSWTIAPNPARPS
jgi:hypothetical protein